MRNLTMCIFCTLLLSGCITPMQAMRGVGTVKRIGAEKIADKVLDTNVRQTCQWPTIGSLERRYGDNPTKYKQYRKFCGHAE